ncbi:MAG: DUF4212 domain-containing protein [Caldilineaceae bacterium]|nr:DUF4212 domain-containing protein [Caldilineaceae bacterium]
MTKSTTAPKGKGKKPKGAWSVEKAQRYWRKNLTIIGILLLIWALVSYGAGILLADLLYNVPFGQLPMSFWFAQQGAIIVFVVLIFVYCWIMDRVDEEFDVKE